MPKRIEPDLHGDTHMKKNKDIYDMTDICGYYGLSESTIRKKVRESTKHGIFSKPIFLAA